MRIIPSKTLFPTMVNLCLSLGLMLCLGCKQNDGKFPISGSVTFDGTAIEQGIISFQPDDGQIAPESTDIVDGKYQIRVPSGKMTVKIYAERAPSEAEISKRKSNPMMAKSMVVSDALVQYIPQEYNERSILKYEVREANSSQNFELKSSE